ncbi:MAG: hypothetical protein ACREEC_03815 [Thermoplasmata archaeon]
MASVKVRDGLVLGTDSMTTIATRDGRVLKAYSNANKLFRLGDCPIGVMTWGIGNVGELSIGGVVRDFAKSADPDVFRDIGATAQALFDYIKPAHVAAFPGAQAGQNLDLGLYVGGFSEDRPLSHEYEFLLPRDAAPLEVRAPAQLGSSWRGVDRPFSRLAIGVDRLGMDALKQRGMTDAELEQILQQTRLQVIFDGMPVQDAINYCSFILDTTIGWAAFHWGSQSCARPLQVAAILPGDGFRWISRPDFSVPSMEPIGGAA